MPLNNFGVCSDCVWRSAQPDGKGLADFAQLAVGGDPCVMKLNDEMLEQERAWCAAPSASVPGTMGVPSIELLDRRILTFTVLDAKLVELADELERRAAAQQAVLVHCEHGRERTGLIIAVWRVKHRGFTFSQARDEMRTYGVFGIVGAMDVGLIKQLDRICHNLGAK